MHRLIMAVYKWKYALTFDLGLTNSSPDMLQVVRCETLTTNKYWIVASFLLSVPLRWTILIKKMSPQDFIVRQTKQENEIEKAQK